MLGAQTRTGGMLSSLHTYKNNVNKIWRSMTEKQQQLTIIYSLEFIGIRL